MTDNPPLPDCERCNGTGVIVLKLLRGGWGGTRYLCGGTAPDYARGVIEDDCDVCGGVGYIAQEEEEGKGDEDDRL